MWNPNMDNRQMEKRVVVGRVRPTWARNLPEAREDDEKSEAEAGVMPHSEPPSPTETWEQHSKHEDKYDVFGKVSKIFYTYLQLGDNEGWKGKVQDKSLSKGLKENSPKYFVSIP